jgi:copper chaperone
MTETTVIVTGMTCDHCVHAVRAEVSKVTGVQNVDADLASGRVTIVSAGDLDRDAVAGAVAEAGYEVTS